MDDTHLHLIFPDQLPLRLDRSASAATGVHAGGVPSGGAGARHDRIGVVRNNAVMQETPA